MAKCKACGRYIIFVMSPSGKAIPCDPDPVNYWRRMKAKGKAVTRNGEVVSCDFEGDLEKCTGIGFVPHWATCTEPDRFRRKK